MILNIKIKKLNLTVKYQKLTVYMLFIFHGLSLYDPVMRE